MLETKEMKNKGKRLISTVLLFLFSVSIWSYLNQSVYSISRQVPYIAFVVAYGVLGFFLQKRDEIIDLSIIALLVYDLFSLVINNGGIGSLLIQVYIIVFITTIKNIVFTRNELRYLLLVNFIIWVAWIVRSQGYYTAFSFDPTILNSNGAAEITLFSFEFITIILRLFYSKHKYLKVFVLGLWVVTFWGLWGFQSRSVEVAAIFFIICLYIIPSNFWNKFNVVLMSMIIGIGGTIFPFIYLLLQNNTYLSQQIYDLTSKSLYSGRQNIWIDVIQNGFNNSLRNWLLGLGSNANSGVSTIWGTNMHNSYLLIILDFGILGLILFGIYVIKNVINVYNTSVKFKNSNIIIFLFAFWSFMIIGWSETIMVWEMTLPFVFSFLAFGQNYYWSKEEINK